MYEAKGCDTLEGRRLERPHPTWLGPHQAERPIYGTVNCCCDHETYNRLAKIAPLVGVSRAHQSQSHTWLPRGAPYTAPGITGKTRHHRGMHRPPTAPSKPTPRPSPTVFHPIARPTHPQRSLRQTEASTSARHTVICTCSRMYVRRVLCSPAPWQPLQTTSQCHQGSSPECHRQTKDASGAAVYERTKRGKAHGLRALVAINSGYRSEAALDHH